MVLSSGTKVHVPTSFLKNMAGIFFLYPFIEQFFTPMGIRPQSFEIVRPHFKNFDVTDFVCIMFLLSSVTSLCS